jgi:hypothetical protein
MTRNYSKLIRKKLRELAGLAHEERISVIMLISALAEVGGCPLETGN